MSCQSSSPLRSDDEGQTAVPPTQREHTVQSGSEIHDRSARAENVPERLTVEEEIGAVTKQIEAVARIYRVQWPALFAVARKHLFHARVPEAEYSGEDVLQSSMRTFLQQIIAGKIDAIEDDQGALRIVRRLILKKVVNRSVYMHALKRSPVRGGDGGEAGTIQASRQRDRDDEDEQARIADTLDLKYCGVPSAEVELLVEDVIAGLMSLLEPELQTVARMRLDTYTVPETAAKLGLSKRTVDRRLERIREIWAKSGLLEI